MTKTVTPYQDTEAGKKKQVAKMFDNIAPTYDFLNHFLSLGIDKLWRKKTIRLLKKNGPKQILDVATGTGDFAIATLKLNPEKVTGVDISQEMLAVGKKKISRKGLDNMIELQLGDSENLQFADNTFDAITVGFGVRNFENLRKGLEEMRRVLKPGGTLAVLEFSRPKTFPIKQIFHFYFKYILPRVGGAVSKDKKAYVYLHESASQFPEGDAFEQELKFAGFKTVKCERLTFGISSIYLAQY